MEDVEGEEVDLTGLELRIPKNIGKLNTGVWDIFEIGQIQCKSNFNKH